MTDDRGARGTEHRLVVRSYVCVACYSDDGDVGNEVVVTEKKDDASIVVPGIDLGKV